MAGPDGLAPGTLIAGEYRILRRLAAGGMGAVYVAEQVSTGALRALKVVLPELVTDAQMRRRFEREARVGARIESEHVVEVLAAGVDEPSGLPYLVMELLDGEDLEAYVTRGGPLGCAETRAVLAQLCHAVGAAHRSGIVHRDLKLENVFRAVPRGKSGEFRIKVLDFGIAKLLTEVQQTAARTQRPLGTPLYMAPEQANPKLGAVGPAADVWALGLIAFRLLTGKHFWLAAYDPEGSLGMLVAETCYEALPRASERATALGAPGPLPPGFDAWMAGALARDPKARYADASLAFGALEPVLVDATGLGATLPASGPPMASGPRGSTEAAMAPAASGADGADAHAPTLLDRGARLAVERAPASRRRLAAAAVASLVALAAVAWLGWRAAGSSASAPLAPGTDAPTTASGASSSDAPAGGASSAATPSSAAPPPPPPCPGGMVLVPAGTFRMGSEVGQGGRDEHPARDVRLSAYCIDRTEVTVAAYRACTLEERAGVRCAPAPTTASWAGVPAGEVAFYGRFCNGDRRDLDAHPVNCVDWAQADAFCRSLAGRLPTEAEWERAARGDDARPYPWGREDPSPDRLNVCGTECREATARPGMPGLGAAYERADAFATTAPVGQFLAGASPAGVLDLAGNVMEWTADWYAPYDPATTVDPVRSDRPAGNAPRRVARGGGWDAGALAEARAARRGPYPSELRFPHLGFRCVATPRPGAEPAPGR
ncbi:MAG: SUMF1/EgtB/PvdO family nonheme iron enzyme [Myxococcales bacterium]|nr:SUMF1/EgtB/PvdO family nonheme iron enzyme [Myxococcales bacterium]